MKRTLILTAAVLAVALAVCVASLLTLNGIVNEAERLLAQAEQAEGAGDIAGAQARLEALAEYWHGRSTLMEVLASHDALHDVDAAVDEARICLACGAHEDFLRAMSAIRAGLAHLKDEEALRLSNLY